MIQTNKLADNYEEIVSYILGMENNEIIEMLQHKDKLTSCIMDYLIQIKTSKTDQNQI
jgi:hypothetical protein